jgi:hypothetical protein
MSFGKNIPTGEQTQTGKDPGQYIKKVLKKTLSLYPNKFG